MLQKKIMIECPHDRHHYLPGDSLNTHASKCELLKRGCPREDLVNYTSALICIFVHNCTGERVRGAISSVHKYISSTSRQFNDLNL